MSPEWGGEELNEMRHIGGHKPQRKDGVGHAPPKPCIPQKMFLLNQNKSTHKQHTFKAFS